MATTRPYRAARPRAVKAVLSTAAVAVIVGAGLAGSAPADAVGGPVITDQAYLPIAKVQAGSPGVTGSFGCTGVLVAPKWIATAKDCWSGPIVNGPPPVATTVTVGRLDLTGTAGSVTTVTELVPRPDRDLVLARLAKAVTGITPAPVDATAPAAGATLSVAGYGRTSTEWVPGALHAATFTVRGVAATTLDIVGADDAAPSTCPGDAGGPSFRTVAGGGLTLVALHSRSSLKGCYGVAATGDGSTETRLDDIAGWIAEHTATQPTTVAASTVGDFTGDGRDDLTYVDQSTGHLWIYPGTDTIRFGVGIDLGGTWLGMGDIVAGDFNQDGRDDVLATESGSGKIWLYPGGGNGTLGARVQFSSAWQPNMTQLAAGDFGGDAHDELIAVEQTTGKLWLYPSTPTGLGTRVQIGGGGWDGYSVLTVGDFNHDGHDDLVAEGARGSTGSDILYRVAWLYPGTGKFTTGAFGARTKLIDLGINAFAPVIAAGRFDEDSRVDLLVSRSGPLTSLSLRPGSADGSIGEGVEID